MDRTLPRITTFDVTGNNVVDKVRWLEATPPQAPSPSGGMGDIGRIYINVDQYFGNVPRDVWDMHIGGYRVAEKWLKDRRGRTLSYDDMEHYQAVISALSRTLALQVQIDSTIERAGGWPLQ